MFSGIVESLGDVIDVDVQPPGLRLSVRCPTLSADAAVGDSIAVNGCCLTVVRCDERTVAFDVGPETLRLTNLGSLSAGSAVNLERSLHVGDRLGGHFVSGHIDGIGRLDARVDDREWSTCWFQVPAELTRQMAGKGCVAVDGVSLTIVDVQYDRFSVALIPHTLAATTLGRRAIGDAVNIETDLLAKYVQKQLAGQVAIASQQSAASAAPG